MKTTLVLTILLATATLTQAQDSSKWMCRNLSDSGGFIYQGETVFGSQACRPIPQVQAAPALAAQAVKQDSAPATAQAASAPLPVAQAAPMIASTRIVPGATVFIEPMDGFENYLAAALLKKKVQLVAVANRDQAQYVISGTSDQKKAGWAKMAFTGNIHSDNAASVTMSDRRTGAIVFAYAVDKKNTLHGQQTTAEACAKHLQDKIKSEN